MGLLHEIQEAFQDVEYPGDDNIIKNTEYPESYDMWLEFKGKHWRDIPSELTERWRMSFVRFTPQGFWFYLPALLIAAIDPTPFEVDIYLIHAFIPPDKSSRLGEFQERMNLLTPSQKSVVIKFMKQFFEDNPIPARKYKEKSDSFWQSE